MKIFGGQIASDSDVLLTQEQILEPKMQGKIREELGLKISRFPLALSIAVHLEGNRAGLSIRGSHKGLETEVNSEGCGEILGDAWHPIRSPELVEIQGWLKDQGINAKNFTFSDGLKLRTKKSECPVPLTFNLNFSDKPLSLESKIQNVVPYKYQFQGIAYLKYMSKSGVGCVLADEMGLGKTLQVIGYLTEKHPGAAAPSLVIAPATLLENWRREFEKFAPQLQVVIRRSGSRSYEIDQFDGLDVVVTSYDTMAADIGLLSRFEWGTLVLDEAQYIKNPNAKRTIFAKRLSRDFSIAVTGTPFENHLTDTWSLIDFAYPGYLTSLKEFTLKYSETVEDAEGLSWVVEPLVLRRLVADVAKDLPERIDIPVFLEPESELITRQNEIFDEVRKPGGNLLAQIQNLRTLAAHATLDELSFRKSAKFEYLKDILLEIFTRSEKVLIFCSFNLTAERIREWLEDFWPGHFTRIINGTTPVEERQTIIDQFSRAENGVLVLNPQAAGVGLNITAANHVIHFNPEWNPALTEQASKRAHRNGQIRPVAVHYLFYTRTIEEIVASSQDLKRAIGKALVPGVLLPLSEKEAIKRLIGSGTYETNS